MLLNIIHKDKQENIKAHLNDMAQILTTSLEAAMNAQVQVETMVSISDNHWHEIVKVSHIHRSSMVFMGLTKIMSDDHKSQLERTFSRMNCHIGLLRISKDWELKDMKRILVPVGGNTVHNALRARFINSIIQFINPNIVINYLLILPESTTLLQQNLRRKVWQNLVFGETNHPFELIILLGGDVSKKLIETVVETDLVLLGLNYKSKKKRVFGKIISSIIEETYVPILIIGQGN